MSLFLFFPRGGSHVHTAQIIFMYLLLLHPLLRGLGHEVARTRKMLLMIPNSAIAQVPAIRDFLTR